MVRAAWTIAVAAAAGIVVSATAFAAKPGAPPTATVDCGTDGTFTVLVNNGNGNFTPAKIVGGGVLIPVAFSNQHATFTDPQGNTFEQTSPDVSHNAPAHKHLMSCHFTVTFTDPSGGSGTFEGDVVAFKVPQR